VQRRILWLFVALGLMFTGAASAQTLTVLGPWAGSEADEFMPVLRAFTQQTGIQVQYRTFRAEDLSQTLPAQFAAGRTPADVIFMWGWWIAENARHAVDLAAQARDVPFITDPVTVGNQTVALPYLASVKPGFWYRKSFFKANGLTAPNSWAEFNILLARLRNTAGVRAPIASGNGVGWPLSDTVEHFLATYGGAALNERLMAGTVRWQDPAVRSVFADRIVPLLQRGYFSDPIEWTNAVELWWRGDYGLFFMGNWVTGMVDDPDDLGVFTLPGATAVVGGTDHLFVPRYSANVAAARRLVDFLMSRRGVEIRVAEGGKLSMRSDIGPEHYPPAERELATALAGLSIIDDLDDTVGGSWQRVFWDQLKLLWVRPGALSDVLRELDARR